MTSYIDLCLDIESLVERSFKGFASIKCTVLWDLLTGFFLYVWSTQDKFLIPQSRIILNNLFFSCCYRWAHAPASESHAGFSRYLIIAVNHVSVYHSTATKYFISFFLFSSLFLYRASFSLHSLLLVSRIHFHRQYEYQLYLDSREVITFRKSLTKHYRWGNETFLNVWKESIRPVLEKRAAWGVRHEVEKVQWLLWALWVQVVKPSQQDLHSESTSGWGAGSWSQTTFKGSLSGWNSLVFAWLKPSF